MFRGVEGIHPLRERDGLERDEENGPRSEDG